MAVTQDLLQVRERSPFLEELGSMKIFRDRGSKALKDSTTTTMILKIQIPQDPSS